MNENFSIFYTGLTEVNYISNDNINYYHCPLIKVEFFEEIDKEKILEIIEDNIYLIFISKNSVIGYKNLLEKYNLQSNFSNQTIFSIGSKTKSFIENLYSVKVNAPQQENALGLTKLLSKYSKCKTIIISAQKTRKELKGWLDINSWQYLFLYIYKVHPKKNKILVNKWQNISSEFIIFTSPSTVKSFLWNLNLVDLSNVQSKLISIGKTTTAEILINKGKVYYESDLPNIDKLMQEARK